MIKTLLSSNDKAFFLYDLKQIELNIESIKGVFPKREKIFYSVKSNPNPSIIKKINSLPGLGFDVSTEEELRHVLNCRVSEELITFSGPAKTNAAIKFLRDKKLKSIHLDSEEEYQIFKNTGASLSLRMPLEESFSQKVGLSLETIERILSSHQDRRFLGFHIYIGRERAGREIILKYQEKINTLIKKFPYAFKEMPEIFWGGGFPQVDFLSSEMMPSFPGCQIHLECGRVISSTAGIYFCPVLSLKKRNENLVIVEGGLQHLATHFSSPKHGQKGIAVQFYKASGDFLRVDPSAKRADVYGSLGVWHDLLLKDIPIPQDLSCGDWIGVSPAGAYGLTAATNQFIGSVLPKEYVITNDQIVPVGPDKFVSYLEAGIYENSKN